MKRKVNNEPMYEVKVGHDINTEVTIASAIVDACTLLNTIDHHIRVFNRNMNMHDLGSIEHMYFRLEGYEDLLLQDIDDIMFEVWNVSSETTHVTKYLDSDNKVDNFGFYRKSTFNYDRVSKNVYNVTFESSANTYKFTYIIKRNRSAFGFDVEMTVDSSSYIKYSHMANNSMVNILLNLITTSDDYVIHRAISYIYVLYSKSKLIDPVELNELIDIFIRTDDHCKSKLDEFIYRIKNEPTGIYNAYNSIKHYSVTMDEFYPIFETIKDIICKCI